MLYSSLNGGLIGKVKNIVHKMLTIVCRDRWLEHYANCYAAGATPLRTVVCYGNCVVQPIYVHLLPA